MIIYVGNTGLVCWSYYEVRIFIDAFQVTFKIRTICWGDPLLCKFMPTALVLWSTEINHSQSSDWHPLLHYFVMSLHYMFSTPHHWLPLAKGKMHTVLEHTCSYLFWERKELYTGMPLLAVLLIKCFSVKAGHVNKMWALFKFKLTFYHYSSLIFCLDRALMHVFGN